MTAPTRREPLYNFKRTLGPLALAVYVGSVVLANYLTTHDGLVPIGFGLVCTAGTIAIGGAILVRDLLQDALGRTAVLISIVAAAVLSYAVSRHQIAVASGLTFLIGETLELIVYTPLRRRSGFATVKWSGVVTVANVIGALADTFLFLWLAGFPVIASTVAGQMVGKLLYVTVPVVVLAPVLRRAVRPVTA